MSPYRLAVPKEAPIYDVERPFFPKTLEYVRVVRMADWRPQISLAQFYGKVGWVSSIADNGTYLVWFSAEMLKTRRGKCWVFFADELGRPGETVSSRKAVTLG